MRWENFEDRPADFEKLAKMLIIREHPDAIPIDGRGGDGGVDLRWESPDGLVVFECKKFTRITSTQKRNIKRSLSNAARHDPIRWVLVAPVDPTPALCDWFSNQLAAEVPFPLQWLGRTWLDQRIAANPDIRRATLDGAQVEVFRAVAEARAETDYMLTASDFVSRAMTLQNRANELSPSWNIRWDTETQQLIAAPKTGAAPDEVHIDYELDFPVDEDAQATRRKYEEVVAFGGTITIPPRYVTSISIAGLEALGLEPGPGSLTISSDGDDAGLPMPATLRITGGGQPSTRPLQISLTHREKGTEGITLRGMDSTGLLTTRILLRRRRGQQAEFSVHLNIDDGSGSKVPLSTIDPSGLHRLYELAAGIDADRTMEICFPTDRLSIPITMPAEPEFVNLRNLVGDLLAVRDALGLVLPVPHRWTRSDERNIRFAAQLLRDEPAPLPFPPQLRFTQNPSDHLELSDKLKTDGVSMQISDESLPLTFNGVSFEIGPLWIRLTKLHLEGPEACRETALAGREVECVFTPGPDSAAVASLSPFSP
ncbi:hypothetical protein [Lentzea flaviverrucosa]|uniref:hypothetical protein n=1 Tax=Lentzea flaviverrucosa TaxID=200379 RepID=UPI000E0C0561|nr:hypothetical protein [Lentzea flaviverrucosa]